MRTGSQTRNLPWIATGDFARVLGHATQRQLGQTIPNCAPTGSRKLRPALGCQRNSADCFPAPASRGWQGSATAPTMKLHHPFIITPRLLPGVRIGNAFVSIEWSKRPGRDGRARYQYHIDAPEWSHSDDDLQSGCGGGDLMEGMASLLSFLDACAESRRYSRHSGRPGENADLFPENVGEWAEQNADEIAMAKLEIEENPNCIEA